MCIAFFAIAVAAFIFKGRLYYTYIILGTLFGAAALIMPVFLSPLHYAWMRLAFVLGWINTHLILFAIFYLVVSPVALIMKICAIDVLEKNIVTGRKTYWREAKEGSVFGDYRKQF
jgi:cytochrome c oxidase subunit IV